VLDGEQGAAEESPARVGGAPPLADDQIARVVGVEDVEQAGRGVVARERDRQQAALAGVVDARVDVQERRRGPLTADDELHPARLLHHEEPRRVARRAGDVDRLGERPSHRDR
jgi:hypothetical protein